MFDDRHSKAIPASSHYNIGSKDFDGKKKFHMGIKLKD